MYRFEAYFRGLLFGWVKDGTEWKYDPEKRLEGGWGIPGVFDHTVSVLPNGIVHMAGLMDMDNPHGLFRIFDRVEPMVNFLARQNAGLEPQWHLMMDSLALMARYDGDGEPAFAVTSENICKLTVSVDDCEDVYNRERDRVMNMGAPKKFSGVLNVIKQNHKQINKLDRQADFISNVIGRKSGLPVLRKRATGLIGFRCKEFAPIGSGGVCWTDLAEKDSQATLLEVAINKGRARQVRNSIVIPFKVEEKEVFFIRNNYHRVMGGQGREELAI